MAFYGIPDAGSFQVYFLQSGSPGTTAVYNTYSVDADFNAYYNQPVVKYAADAATALTQILKQNILRSSAIQVWSPIILTGGQVFRHLQPALEQATVQGLPCGSSIRDRKSPPILQIIPRHSVLNSGGNDDINGLMWILK